MAISRAKTAGKALETPRDLRNAIARLSERSPATDRFTTAWDRRGGRGQRERDDVWYDNQRQHWLGYLDDWPGPGFYGRKVPKRSARFIYTHIVNPQMLVYLADAAALDAKLVAAAARAGLRERSMAAMSGAIRRVIPWEVVEAALLWSVAPR